MTTVFADTLYYIALVSTTDRYHKPASEYTANFSGRIVTTAWVLVELANHLAQAPGRSRFLLLLQDLRADARVRIFPPSEEWFARGVERYARRLDKDWSLTDCISFLVMEQEQITEALTADHHFEQAGFTILLPSPE